jgi:hypothetical protein
LLNPCPPVGAAPGLAGNVRRGHCLHGRLAGYPLLEKDRFRTGHGGQGPAPSPQGTALSLRDLRQGLRGRLLGTAHLEASVPGDGHTW